jgi:hypothetical protein
VDPKLKEVFETEYSKIPGFVQSFLEKNSLKDKLEKFFINLYKDRDFNSFHAKMNIMLGDADGDDDYECSFPLRDLPLLRKWFEAYGQKYDVNDEYFWLGNCGCCDGPSGRIGWEILKTIIYAEGPISIGKNDYVTKPGDCYSFNLEYDTMDLKYCDQMKDEISMFTSNKNFIKEYLDWGGDDLYFEIMPYALWWEMHDYQDEYLIEVIERRPF